MVNLSKYSPYPGDKIPAVLEDGEYVLNRNAVKAIGKKKLDQINNVEEPRFAQNGGFMENAGFPTQNKFKLGLARKMARGGIATEDAQKKRNSINDKEYSDFIQNMNAPLKYQPELPGQYPQDRFNNDLADSLYNANFDSLEADYIGKNPYNFMQGPKELQGPQQNPNDRYISDREAELRGFGEDPYYEADYISDEQASKMGFDIPENVQGPEERMSLANLNLDNYTDEFGLDGGNLNLPRPADSFEIRKGDNEFDYPSGVKGSLPENQPKSLLGYYAKKYADRMDKAVDAIEPSMQMVGERGIEAGSKAGVLAKDIASQVKGLPKDTKRKASSLFNRVKKKFNTGKQQGKYYKDNTPIKSKSKKPVVKKKSSEEALEALSNLNLKTKVTPNIKEESSNNKAGSKLPKSIGTVDETDYLTKNVLDPLRKKEKENRRKRNLKVVQSKLAKGSINGASGGNLEQVSVPLLQKGGEVNSMKRPGGYSIGTPNVEKIMKQNLKKIQSDKVIKDRLKQRAKGDMKLYRKHIKVRENNGSLLTSKEVQRTLQYFANKTGAKKMQEGGMVNSTGGAMSGAQMNSRRLLNMAKRRKNVRS